MKGLAELVVSLCDLCEAEGRLLEAGVLRTVRRAALLSLGLAFGAAALALLLAALYAVLTALLPRPAALGLLGLASAAIAGLLLWSARGRATPPGETAGEELPQPQAANAPDVRAEAPHVEAAAAVSEEKADQNRGPWAHVPPYGHSARSGERRRPGASPQRQSAAAESFTAGRKHR